MSATKPTKTQVDGPIDRLLEHTVQLIKRDKAEFLMLGPIVLDLDDKPYFVMVTGREKGACHIDQMKAYSQESAEQLRAGTMIAAIQFCRPIVINDFDDELQLARWGEAMWPERFTSIRTAIEAERDLLTVNRS